MVVAAAREAGLMVVAEGGSLYHMDMNIIADGNTGLEHNLPPERPGPTSHQHRAHNSLHSSGGPISRVLTLLTDPDPGV